MKQSLRALTILKVFALGLTLVASVACSSPTSSDSKVSHIAISSVDWAIENIDRTFWKSADFDGLFYDFWITYTGTLNVSDVKEVRIAAADKTVWTLYPTKSTDSAEYVDTKESTIGGWGRWYLGTVSGVSRYYTLPLGTLTATVEYNDGTLVTGQATSHEPGVSTAPSHTYAVNDTNKYGLDGTVGAPALARPVVNSASLNATALNLTVTLALSDANTSNGVLWFYNAQGTYLGRSVPFRDKTTGVVSPMFGSSSPVFNVNGTNTLTLTAANLLNDDGTPGNFLSNISTVRPVVYDGAQYVSVATTNKYGHYDYASIGAGVTVTKN